MEIGFLVFPRHTPLDLVGPWEVLSRIPESHAHLIWTRPGPVQSERKMEISATVGFDDVPRLDILVVPGGPGQLALMKHASMLEFLRAQAKTATWVCSVCTGALLLAQAGLLKGHRATTHWLARDALKTFGVKVVDERYVIDGKFGTSAGVSAGIDLALELVRLTAGDELAKTIQLEIEYDPAPPFDSGSPAKAPAAIVTSLQRSARQYH